MADLYTSLYGSKAGVGTASGALTATTTYFYNGPCLGQEGQTCLRKATYTGTIANGDVLHLAGGLRDGETLISLDISTSTDPDTDNDGEVDIGTTTDPNGILELSQGLRAAADVNVETSGQADATLVAVNGDEYLLTMTTGEHEVSATYTFTILTGI